MNKAIGLLETRGFTGLAIATDAIKTPPASKKTLSTTYCLSSPPFPYGWIGTNWSFPYFKYLSTPNEKKPLFSNHWRFLHLNSQKQIICAENSQIN